MVKPLIAERILNAKNNNYSGWHKSLIQSFIDCGFTIQNTNTLISRPILNGTKRARLRCYYCKDEGFKNENRSSKQCDECAQFCCPTHLEEISKDICLKSFFKEFKNIFLTA